MAAYYNEIDAQKAAWLRELIRFESGLLPLAHGSAARVRPGGDSSVSIAESTEARVMRLRGYGDGIVAQVAAEFIEAYMEVRDGVGK